MPSENYTPSQNEISTSSNSNNSPNNESLEKFTNPQKPAQKIALLLSTRNHHKLQEIAQILGPTFDLWDLSSIPNPPIISETGHTFLENATLKALTVSKIWQGWVIADDSGLVVDAINGQPGVHSARFAGENATDQQNCDLLLKRLSAFSQRSARFICVIALAKQGKIYESFEGILEGKIALNPKGNSGFGYDPLFIPSGHLLTLAEMSQDSKNLISHRRLALEKLKRWPGFSTHQS